MQLIKLVYVLYYQLLMVQQHTQQKIQNNLSIVKLKITITLNKPLLYRNLMLLIWEEVEAYGLTKIIDYQLNIQNLSKYQTQSFIN